MTGTLKSKYQGLTEERAKPNDGNRYINSIFDLKKVLTPDLRDVACFEDNNDTGSK